MEPVCAAPCAAAAVGRTTGSNSSSAATAIAARRFSDRREHDLQIIAASILSGVPRSSAPHVRQAGGIGADDGGGDNQGKSEDSGGGEKHRRAGPGGPAPH